MNDMKKQIITLSLLSASVGMSFAQSAIGAYSISQSDLKGTARYMGMAGAFGALGGDLSAISQNPAGIGVYRSSDIGFSVDLDCQGARTQEMGLSPNGTWQAFGQKYDLDQTKFLLNNIGAVFTLRLNSQSCPNLNLGFTYNRGASYNRIYGGNINTLHTSMSNYIAGIANANDVTEGDVSWADGINPYDPGYGYFVAPWITTLAYDSYVISPQLTNNGTKWYGLWQDSMSGRDTSGSGSFVMQESGSTSEFNIVLGGNIADKLYWGMNFQINNLNYSLNTSWGESLTNAYRLNSQGKPVVENADWEYDGFYNLSGTGFSYQLGLIFKPVQAFRLGFSFHTPTWYNLNEQFLGSMNYNGENDYYNHITNENIPGYTSYGFRTPWKIMASAAGVLRNNFIVSFDYEWSNYGKMHYSETYESYYDDWNDYPWPMSASTRANYTDYLNWNDPYGVENSQISTYYKSTNTFRVGLEFKPVSSFSVRAGYSYSSSPVKKDVLDNKVEIATANLFPSYRFDNSTNYITAGIGYRYSHIYVDLAYVYKHINSTFHAFTPDTMNPQIPSPQAKLSLNNNQIVLSAGYRF